MADNTENNTEHTLEGGAYEIIRQRLGNLGEKLLEAINGLNGKRKNLFGALESQPLGAQRIQTDNNCVPRDMINVGGTLIFGYNVFLGLKKETPLEDVFSFYSRNGDNFEKKDFPAFDNKEFIKDFRDLYVYYKKARFATFRQTADAILLVFQTGDKTEDIKVFKWALTKEEDLRYLHNRAEREYIFPPQHDFDWIETTRENHVTGIHPHVTIEDRVFVETVGGDLTVKIENNTSTGEGIYSEPVDNADQTLNDGIIYYASMGSIILLKVLPYQEKTWRYIIFDEKKKKAYRVDDMGRCAVRLPENDGLIFPGGYYLLDQGYKSFNLETENMKYIRKIISPNGEDFLYVFYNEESGEYILLQYNLISKKVEKPLTCHGYTIYDDGKMIFFKAAREAARSHSIQVWQTPFVKDLVMIKTGEDSYLSRVGNKDLVNGISDIMGLYNLITNEETYLGLYHEISRKVTNTLDLYFWLGHEESFGLKDLLQNILNTANSAIDEYEKVVRIRQNTKEQMEEIARDVKGLLTESSASRFTHIEEFVKKIGEMKLVLGRVISQKDLRYADMAVIEKQEADLSESLQKMSGGCIDFLLKEGAFAPYFKQLEEINIKIPVFKKSADMKEAGKAIVSLDNALNLLTDLVNSLKVDDPVKSARIIENISAVFSRLNQIKAELKNHRKELLSKELGFEFNAQFTLLNQTLTNALDQASTPEKCEELLTKITVQIEDLETHFTDFEEYVEKLTIKREEIYSAFNNRKIQLQEVRNKKSGALSSAGARILKGISSRTGKMKSVDELNSFFASDMMVAKVQDIIRQLMDLGDSVKAEDMAGQLKSMQQDGARQLKDRLELFTGGQNLITLGNFRFTVNTRGFELTTVNREGSIYFHMTGTDFFELLEDKEFGTTRPFWDQELVSENKTVYRGAYLAFKFLKALEKGEIPGWQEETIKEREKLSGHLRDFMSSFYDEGYEKGIHDHDGVIITKELHKALKAAGPLRFHPLTRAYASIYWFLSPCEEKKKQLACKLKALALMEEKKRLHTDLTTTYSNDLKQLIENFFRTLKWPYNKDYLIQAPGYIVEEILNGRDENSFTVHKGALEVMENFKRYRDLRNLAAPLNEILKEAGEDLSTKLSILSDWIGVTLQEGVDRNLIPEAVFLYLQDRINKKQIREPRDRVRVEGLLGDHPLIRDKSMEFHLPSFLAEMEHFHTTLVPAYKSYQKRKQDLSSAKSKEMRLEEFKPRVLTSFIRNKLIDKTYLPLIGANLAKQMGAYGEEKRTDLMGLLLLISPPGYGKTTLMEYVANRLGLIFMKINAPAIGHKVTSLDPVEAPNSTARKEIEKCNLALEMGNNVMLYIDDIQHSNPEFLQKFISLCDAQRKIEGVFRGETRTYDLRGKKFCVVMAGNPYTESGEKFQVPDMLANRADTYNLGDIIGGSGEYFRLSYLENSLTSNSVLSRLAVKSQHDIYEMIKIARTGSSEGINFETRYSMEEVNEFVKVFEKLLVIQEVVLNVNQMYIYSAAQDDAYRTEPPFLLQGSYRNMNKMAEKVLPIMNDKEIKQLILDHYSDESQLLTSGAEFNLLRFKEARKWLDKEEEKRLEEIRSTFRKNRSLGAVKEGDPMSQIMGQINFFNDQFSGFLDWMKRKEN